MQRAAINTAPVNEVPPIVHEVLRSPGQPLDAGTRAFMEPRFGHDFSGVQVHTDAKAAESAQAVNALAYTVGNAIVFGAGQYRPDAVQGRQLVAHELTHILQQRSSLSSSSPEIITHAHDHSETEAERIADQIASGQSTTPLARQPGSRLMRKLRIDRPAEMLPNPTGQWLRQTNAETVEGYLRRISPSGGVTVDRTSGEVSMTTGYCPGILGGLLQGARSGYRIGYNIGSIGGNVPVLGPIFGLVGGFIGAIGGAIAGLFGATSPSPAAASATPTGSTCLCDFVNSGPETTIQLNDQERPAGAATLVKVPSPNSRKEWGSATIGGRLESEEPWLILAHELCGHAWLDIHEHGDEEGRREDRAPLVSRNPQTGQIEISEPEQGFEGPMRQARASQHLRHGRTVERENLIRAEHGLEARGYRLRDPYCGESFWRERGIPNPPIHWQETGESDIRTYLEQCEFLRSQLPESRNRKYRIDESIP